MKEERKESFPSNNIREGKGSSLIMPSGRKRKPKA
jgi:hypothetical protein